MEKYIYRFCVIFAIFSKNIKEALRKVRVNFGRKGVFDGFGLLKIEI